MVTAKELESKIAYFRKLNDTIIKFSNLRIRIAEKRNAAISMMRLDLGFDVEIYDKEVGKARKILSNCVKNERNIMTIIGKALEEEYDTINECVGFIKREVKDQEIVRNSIRLLYIINVFRSRIKNINSRLEKEEKYLKKREGHYFDSDKDEDFKEFISLWEQEQIMNKELLNKLVDIDELEYFFKKTLIVLKNAVKPGLTGAALGATTQYEFGINQAFLYFTLFSVCYSIISNLENSEKIIYGINIKKLKKIRGTLR